MSSLPKILKPVSLAELSKKLIRTAVSFISVTPISGPGGLGGVGHDTSNVECILKDFDSLEELPSSL